MTTRNPLALAANDQRKVYDLDQFCAESNLYNFVRSSGRPYFISQMTMPDGTVRRYLDRNA